MKLYRIAKKAFSETIRLRIKMTKLCLNPERFKAMGEIVFSTPQKPFHKLYTNESNLIAAFSMKCFPVHWIINRKLPIWHMLTMKKLKYPWLQWHRFPCSCTHRSMPHGSVEATRFIRIFFRLWRKLFFPLTSFFRHPTLF